MWSILTSALDPDPTVRSRGWQSGFSPPPLVLFLGCVCTLWGCDEPHRFVVTLLHAWHIDNVPFLWDASAWCNPTSIPRTLLRAVPWPCSSISAPECPGRSNYILQHHFCLLCRIHSELLALCMKCCTTIPHMAFDTKTMRRDEI